MRIILIILIGVHGLIHLFGFFKSFGIGDFNALNQTISKVSGFLWLLTFLLFAIALILFALRSDYWWIFGFIASIASQILIITYWSDAKYGTVANIIIFFVAIIACSNYVFRERIKKERVALFNDAKPIDNDNLTVSDIEGLPPIIRKWLTISGAIGKPKTSTIYLTQELQLKLKPEQSEWNSGAAEQYFTTQPPAFNWDIKTEMSSLLSVVGRDKFVDGKGEMIIKLLSVFPVVDVKNEVKVNQATLQRYLAEIVWFPSGAVSSYIQWEELDSVSAKAVLEFNGTKGSGIFYFNNNGEFKKFTAMRFKDSDAQHPTEWTITAQKSEEKNGVKIPTICEVSWQMEDERWTWLKLKIKDIKYNVDKMPVANSQ